MLFFLQRIATQGYTLNSGFLNVTSPPQDPPPFEAPEWALQVNGLWFASLILSLATASFSMLVKSWLREYLAGEWIAPQKRLRARHYRYPSLVKWKVFEIAAVLPLLLQLSLGLFFAGLCIFTAEIDTRMGRTSLPLVVAWAFFLSATTLAPLLSPRCPFKLLLLKHALKLGRKHFTPLVFKAVAFTTVVVLRPTRNRLSHGGQHLMCAARDRLFQLGRRLAYFVPELTHLRPFSTRFSSMSLNMSIDTSNAQSSPFKELLGKMLTQEEENIIDGAQDDIEILLLTDEMMLDDGLLDTMLETLPQSRTDPLSVVDFIMHLVHNRTSEPEPAPSKGYSSPLNITTLSKHAYLTLTASLIDTLLSLDPHALARNDSPDFVKDAITLLISPPPFPLPVSPRSCLVFLNVALSTQTNDHDILRMTDSMMLDDGVVDAIPAGLKKYHMGPSMVVGFALRLIRSCAAAENGTIPLEGLPHILDLSSLSECAYTTLMSIAADLLQQMTQATLNENSPRWMKDAAMLLMSTSPHPLPNDARSALIACLNDEFNNSPAGTTLGHCLKQSISDVQLSTITKILTLALDVPERPNMSSALEIFNVLLGDIVAVKPTLLETIYDPENTHLSSNPAARPILESLWRVIAHAVHAYALHGRLLDDVEWYGQYPCFYAILDLGDRLQKGQDISNALNEWWGSSRLRYLAVATVTAISPQVRITGSNMDVVIERAFMVGKYRGT